MKIKRVSDLQSRAVEVEGTSFSCPRFIQRIDTRSTHGWQCRYGVTKMFSDGVLGGPLKSFSAATKYLGDKLKHSPYDDTSHRKAKEGANRAKTNSMPAGISGPLRRERVRYRLGKPTSQVLVFYEFKVSFPLASTPGRGGGSTVYIASEATYTEKKMRAALRRATSLRQERIEAFNVALGR